MPEGYAKEKPEKCFSFNKAATDNCGKWLLTAK